MFIYLLNFQSTPKFCVTAVSLSRPQSSRLTVEAPLLDLLLYAVGRFAGLHMC